MPLLTKMKKIIKSLTLSQLTWKIRWTPNNASRWQVGFNSAFKGLIYISHLRLGFPGGLCPSDFPTNTLYMHYLHHTLYMPRPSHSSRFCHPNNIGPWEEIITLSLCSFFHSRVTSSLLGPSNLLSTLFSDTLSLCSSLNVGDQFQHQYNRKNYSSV